MTGEESILKLDHGDSAEFCEYIKIVHFKWMGYMVSELQLKNKQNNNNKKNRFAYSRPR